MLIIFCFVLMFLGLVGVIVPFLPGVPLAWLGIFIYAVSTNFEKISLTAVLVFLALTVLLFFLDLLAPMLGAKKYKASKYGILGVFLGAILGIIFFGPLGIIIGPLAGAFLGELLANKKPEQASKSAFGAFLGFIISALIKLIIILIMIGFFIFSLF